MAGRSRPFRWFYPVRTAPLGRLAVAVAVALGADGVAASASAAPRAGKTIAVGEVSAKEAGEDVRALLREFVTREVERLRLSAPSPEAYVLSVSLVSLRVASTMAGTRARGTVSATLRREGDGAILAMMRASATAEGDRKDLLDTRNAALEGAVHAAVLRVPEAI